MSDTYGTIANCERDYLFLFASVPLLLCGQIYAEDHIDEPYFDSDQGRMTLSVAAAWEASAFDKIVKGGVDWEKEFENQPLTLALLTLRLTGDRDRRTVAEFTWLFSGRPRPVETAKALRAHRGSLPDGYVSFIQPRYIKRVTERRVGEEIVGEVMFRIEGLFRGKVEFRARQSEGAWQVTEFRLPAYRRAVVLQEDKKWKIYRLDAGGADSSAVGVPQAREVQVP